MKKMAFFLWVFILCTVQAATADDGLKKVSLIPLWIPQAQFAGYMLALEKGFYAEAGLDVTILRGGPGVNPIEMVKSGAATFGIAWLSSAMEERAAGARLVNLAQIVQRCALLIVADRRRAIRTLQELQNKKVGLWGGDLSIPPRVFFQKHHVSVTVIPNYTTVNLFLRGGVDAMAAMWYNEFHLLLNSGLDRDELTVFFLKDEGVNFPEDGIYCLQGTVDSDPAMCDGFTRASLKGWLYAFSHKEEALDIVMKHAGRGNTETNRAHQAWMLARMEDLILPGNDRAVFGRLDPVAFDEVGQVLVGYGTVNRVPDFEAFYRGPK
jgi:NitT/TauT family transport system substrate-binding protein